ncbi:MAG: hypothetical protein K2Y23_22895 [Cyanobacteria bacterium]|nr:hypothetical protein [Cyanobacteriota bacterium]
MSHAAVWRIIVVLSIVAAGAALGDERPREPSQYFWDMASYVTALDAPNPYRSDAFFAFLYPPVAADIFRLARTHLFELMSIAYVAAIAGFLGAYAPPRHAAPLPLAIGLGALIKPQFLLYVGLLPVLEPWRKSAIKMLMAVLAVSAVHAAYVVLRPDLWNDYVDGVRSRTLEVQDFGWGSAALFMHMTGSNAGAIRRSSSRTWRACCCCWCRWRAPGLHPPRARASRVRIVAPW